MGVECTIDASGVESLTQKGVTSSHNAAGLLRIYINGILHLAFSTKTMAGVQSWNDTKIRNPPMFFIEVTPAKGLPILAEYDDRELWQAVLGEINQAFGRSQGAN